MPPPLLRRSGSCRDSELRGKGSLQNVASRRISSLKGCAQDSMEQAFPATMPPPHRAWRSGQAAGHRRCNVQDEGPLRQDPPGRHGRFPHADPHALPCIRKAKSRRPAASRMDRAPVRKAGHEGPAPAAGKYVPETLAVPRYITYHDDVGRTPRTMR